MKHSTSRDFRINVAALQEVSGSEEEEEEEEEQVNTNDNQDQVRISVLKGHEGV